MAAISDLTQFLQKSDQLLRGAPTVTDGVFHFEAQLGKGPVVAVGLEDGVVAEALGAALLLGDATVATTFEVIGFAVKVQRDAGAESGLAVGFPFHGGEHLVDIVLVAAMLAGKTSRIDARRTAQGLHLEACVVGEAVHMELVGDKVRLDLGGAFDGVGILDDVLMAADIFEAQDLIASFRESGTGHDFAHFAQFVLVIGGEYDLFHSRFKI